MIREATIEDCQAICNLNEWVLGYSVQEHLLLYTLQHILERPHDKIYVAQVNEQIVGYIHVADYATTLGGMGKNIMALCLDQLFQGRGIGKQLLNKAEEWAKSEKAQFIRLNSGINRKQAHSFYQLCGYDSYKEQKRFIKWL